MMEAPAWLMNIGSGMIVGVGERELLHLVEQPQLSELPLAPRHCRNVLMWQGQLLPVWDVRAWIDHDEAAERAIPIVGIVAYQSRRGEIPKYGALMLDEPPKRTLVADSQACRLPVDQTGWDRIAVSCFLHEGEAVPVLDLPRMFTKAIT